MKKKLLSAVLASSIILSSVPMHTEVLAASQSATIVSGVNFREGPSTSDDRIRYLKKGEQVDILIEYNKYWYKVKTERGEIGYISSNSKYIEPNSASAPVPVPVNPAPSPALSPSPNEELCRRKWQNCPLRFISHWAIHER